MCIDLSVIDKSIKLINIHTDRLIKEIRLIQISPELPPTIGGVADYTSILTKRLIEVSEASVQPSMILAGWKKGNEKLDVDFPVEDIAGECSADRLAKIILKIASQSENKPIVLLQYSGYGYTKRGASLWLLRGLQKVCIEKGIPLVTMFHELYATDNPLGSAFWLSPVQRYIASQLAKLSNTIVTNREQSAIWLRKYIEQTKMVCVQPVFSNIGEPDKVIPFAEREPHAVVFGGSRMKQKLYEKWGPNIDVFLLEQGIEKIIDVGQGSGQIKYSKKIPTEKIGVQSKKNISGLLSQSKIGLIDLRLNSLTKSGVFSAYCAHGVTPLVRSVHEDSGSLKEGKHFIRYSKSQIITDDTIDTIGKNSWQWYQGNSHSLKTAEKYFKILESSLKT